MAEKYRERLMKSSGISNIKVESEYARKLMMKMGWQEGKGLGKNLSGTTECLQIRRREENVGLGNRAGLGEVKEL